MKINLTESPVKLHLTLIGGETLELRPHTGCLHTRLGTESQWDDDHRYLRCLDCGVWFGP